MKSRRDDSAPKPETLHHKKEFFAPLGSQRFERGDDDTFQTTPQIVAGRRFPLGGFGFGAFGVSGSGLTAKLDTLEI